MLKRWAFFVFTVLGILAPARMLYGQPGLWQDVASLAAAPTAPASTNVWLQPDVFRLVTLDYTMLQPVLSKTPPESVQKTAASSSRITLPMPDGTKADFRIVESPIMAPELAAQFPEIRTYLGQGIDNPAATVRFDVTPTGFHGQVLSPDGAVYIDPYLRGDTTLHVSYYKRDYRRTTEDFECLTPPGPIIGKPASSITPQAFSGTNLRTYRLACAATGEYVQYHGGTVSLGMAAIVTAINRVTGVYESELAIRLVLVANNNLLVYTNSATDPYNNGSPSTLLSQNQANIDSVIGSGNYDIGHVFSTAGGGLAGLGVVCIAGSKARGETGTGSPIGDPFYIDYVAHEMGHQFGANHTFNSTTGSCNGNRNAGTAYEPGSASTIMGYAGICGADNLQPHSDPYFHSISIDEIVNYTTGGAGNGCAASTPTGNSVPSVGAGPNFTVPKGTPFILTASGSDANGDVLSYCWEERDLGAPATLATADNGSSPLFRSFNPATSPARTFPQLNDVLNNSATPGELMPATSRTLQFRVTARDNRAGGGGVNTADMQVTVVTNAGPFAITSPNTATPRFGSQTITWNVAGTAGGSINATNVNILLSTNGGLSFPLVLASNVPNNGSQTVLLPNIITSAARIKVEAVGNIFFDISDTNFSIMPAAPQVVLDTATLISESCAVTNGVVDPGETVALSLGLKNIGNARTTNLVVTLLSTNGTTFPSAPQTYGAIVAGGATVVQPFSLTATGSCGGSITAVFQLQDGFSNLGIVSQVFNLGASVIATQSATNAGSIAINDLNAASPYPSPITVSNLSGAVTKVSVTLRSLSHTFPDDVDVLLVGPGGQNVMLMSDVGGGNPVSNATFTFDDAAAASLPDTTSLVSGTYKPTNIDTNTDAFPAAAPAGPFGQTLAVFNGVNPNGTWRLYVQDDTGGDSGSIAQGWVLNITTAAPVCCNGAAADLAIGVTVSPALANVGSNFVYTIAITNFGPSTASNVVVSDSLPAGLSFASAVATQGSCATNNGVVTCSLGTITNGSTAIITLTGASSIAGRITNVVTVTGVAPDPVTANNTAAVAIVANAFPTISTINNQVTDEDVQTAALGFIIGDAETAAGALTISGASSNTNLVANTNIVFGGSGANRTVTLIPSTNQFGTTTVSIAVSDGMAVSTLTFLLTVNQVNDPPALAVIANYTIVEGATLFVTNSATDVDLPAQILTFSLGTNAPAGALINATNGLLSWTPTEAQGPGTNAITVRVTDNGTPNLSATRNFLVTVLETNSAPVLSAIANYTITEGDTLSITNSATDSDLPANALTFTLGTSAPAGAVINSTNGIFTWTPSEAQGPSTNLISVQVNDDGTPGLSATQSFTVVVLETNTTPSLSPVANYTVTEGDTLVVTNAASDSDLPANLLTFSLGINAPVGAVINSTNGLLTWTPNEAQGPSTNVITVKVMDDGVPSLSATQSFIVVVLETNSAPALSAIANYTITEGNTLVVTNTASDSDLPANTLTFTLGTNAPAGSIIDSTNGIFTWTPSEAQGPSTNVIMVKVMDDGVPSLCATQTFTVVVLETNSAPVLAPISDITISAGQTLVITNSATDADLPANTLTFSLGTNAPAAAAIDSSSGVFTWTPTESDVTGTNVITVRVTDDGLPNLSASQSFAVIVQSTNLGRYFPPPEDHVVVEGYTLLVTNLVMGSDPPPTNLTFNLETNAPAGATINATNGLFTWTPTEAQGPSTNVICVRVSQETPTVLSATQSFSVIVLETNSPPVLAPIAERTVHAGTVLVVTNSATDPDLPANSLSFSLETGAPPGAALNITNGVLTWPTTAGDANTTNRFNVVVADDGTPSFTDTKSFTVIVMDKPSILSLSVSNNAATVTWSAIAGGVYRLQYTENLPDTNWTELPVDVTATGATATQTDDIGSTSRRFYRVHVVR